MLKVINPQVAKFEYTAEDKKQKLGTNAALLFQHICYWMQTQGVEVVYRTNQQLSEDLEGALSISQVARAKKKLVEAKLITIAQDLKGRFIHTTHYRLTNIGEQVVMALENVTRKVKAVANTVKQAAKHAARKVKIVNTAKVVEETKRVAEMDETTKLLIEEQAHLEGKTFQEVADQYSHTPTQPHVAKQPKKWIPKEEYKAMKQAEYKQQNKEMVVSASMQKSFDEGFSNPNAVKGIPQEVIDKLPKWMQNKVKC